MFKKNKDKIGCVDNASESLTTPQTLVKQSLDVPQLLSSPDNIDNKTSIITENIELDPKINIIEKIDNTIITGSPSIVKDTEQVFVSNEESGGVQKISSKIKDNPSEVTVTKTVEDILNDISSKIVNQTEIINEENLIDELADLNEDLNSVCTL